MSTFSQSSALNSKQRLPPRMMLLIQDNLAGYWTPEVVLWLFADWIMPLYTLLGGSWLTMAESIQWILVRLALDGQHATDTNQIIAWFEAVSAYWNLAPTSFEWGSKRQARRHQHEWRYRLSGSGACARKPVARRLKSGYICQQHN